MVLRPGEQEAPAPPRRGALRAGDPGDQRADCEGGSSAWGSRCDLVGIIGKPLGNDGLMGFNWILWDLPSGKLT